MTSYRNGRPFRQRRGGRAGRELCRRLADAVIPDGAGQGQEWVHYSRAILGVPSIGAGTAGSGGASPVSGGGHTAIVHVAFR